MVPRELAGVRQVMLAEMLVGMLLEMVTGSENTL